MNPLRHKMIFDALAINGGVRTIEALAPHLPPDFDLVADDLAELPIDAEFKAVEPSDNAAPTVDDSDLLPDAERATEMAPTAEKVEAATQRLIDTNNALNEARVTLTTCQRREREANAKLSQAIAQFQSGFDPYSPTDQAHDFARSEQAQRQRVANGEAPPAQITVGKSRIDQARAWQRGLGPDDGHGNPGRAIVEGRPVYPAAKRGAYVGPPKLPSQR